MIYELIGQDGGGGALDYIWWLLPLVCCLLTMSQREERPQASGQEVETFYTTLDISEAFETVEEKVAEWREEAREKGSEQGGIGQSLRRLLAGGRGPVERFTEKDKQPPRLYSLNDSSGTIFFEFTEVEGGGTVIKTTYNGVLKGRISNLKADLPLKIPATPIGLKCPSCGKPILEEFNICPYCGTDLIKE